MVASRADGGGDTTRAGLFSAVSDGMSLGSCATTIAPQGACARGGQHRSKPLPGEPGSTPSACKHTGARLRMRMRACVYARSASSMTLQSAVCLVWRQKPAEAACRGSRSREARSGGIAPRMAIVGTGLYVGSSLYAQQWTAGIGAHTHNTHETCKADAGSVSRHLCLSV